MGSPQKKKKSLCAQSSRNHKTNNKYLKTLFKWQSLTFYSLVTVAQRESISEYVSTIKKRKKKQLKRQCVIRSKYHCSSAN